MAYTKKRAGLLYPGVYQVQDFIQELGLRPIDPIYTKSKVSTPPQYIHFENTVHEVFTEKIHVYFCVAQKHRREKLLV
jgi:hypothetical protein